MAKIDEKNNEMIKLKKTVGSVTQILNHNKVKTHFRLIFKIKIKINFYIKIW